VRDFGPYAIVAGWLRKILLYLSKMFVIPVQYLNDYYDTPHYCTNLNIIHPFSTFLRDNNYN